MTAIREMRYGSPTYGSATQTHTEKSLRVFRKWLNERGFPLTAESKDKGGHAIAYAQRLVDAGGGQPTDAVAAATAKNHARTGERGYHDGWPTEFGSGKHRPSQRRPEATSVAWKTWLPDHERMLVLVSREKHATVQAATEAGESERQSMSVTEYWVTMAEQLTVSIRTDADLDRVNREYTVGVPLVYKSGRGWRVLEPVEECVGPFTSVDAAETAMRSWAAEIRDEWEDQVR